MRTIGDPASGSPITRRRALASFGGLVLVAVGGAAAACGSDGSSAGGSSGTSAGPGASSTASTIPVAPACVLSPELTEGPFYLDLDAVRRDITEGRAGVPLRLAVTVLDVAECTPVAGAAVDIWHCDAGGVYSGFEAGSGQTFLRGVQVTDDAGAATFATIYPGWYAGRTVHIHVKVHLGASDAHTGQLFFSDDVTDAVYARAPYSSRPDRDVRNDRDGILQGAGGAAMVALSRAGSGYEGFITLGVQRA